MDELLALVEKLGVLPAAAIIFCYVHHARKIRPVLVHALALMDAIADKMQITLEARAESKREAEEIVPEAADAPGLLGLISSFANGKRPPPPGPTAHATVNP